MVCASVLGCAIIPIKNSTVSKWLNHPLLLEEQKNHTEVPEKVTACIVGGGLSGLSKLSGKEHSKQLFFLGCAHYLILSGMKVCMLEAQEVC